MELAGQRGIVDDGQDLGLDGGSAEFARASTAGTIGETVDALFVEARGPESQAALATPAVAKNQIIADADEQQVDGIETAVGLAIRTARHGLLKLGERAGFLIGKLARTADGGILTTSNDRTSLL